MIDGNRLKRLLCGAAGLLLISILAAWALGARPAFLGGLALGALLGALPFASWGWIVSRALGTRRGRVLAVLLLAAKLGLYAAVLFVGLLRLRVDPVGVLSGLSGVVFALTLGCLWGGSAPAKEAA